MSWVRDGGWRTLFFYCDSLYWYGGRGLRTHLLASTSESPQAPNAQCPSRDHYPIRSMSMPLPGYNLKPMTAIEFSTFVITLLMRNPSVAAKLNPKTGVSQPCSPPCGPNTNLEEGISPSCSRSQSLYHNPPLKFQSLNPPLNQYRSEKFLSQWIYPPIDVRLVCPCTLAGHKCDQRLQHHNLVEVCTFH